MRDAIRFRIPRRPALVRGLAVLVALAFLLPAAVRAEDDATQKRLQEQLSQARFKENVESRPHEALQMYGRILAQPELEPRIRGDALLGQARCHRTLGETEKAKKVWEQILANPSLPVAVREQAEKDLDKLNAARSTVDPEELKRDAYRQLETKRRAEAEALVDQARREFDEGRNDLARQLCLDAKKLLPEYPEADRLLAKINQAMPDRGGLLRELLRFAESTHVQTFRRLKSEVTRLERDGKNHHQAGAYAEADRAFRMAVERIDTSEFFSELMAERENLLLWLRRTIEDARAEGLELGAVPSFPDPTAVTSSWRRRFFDLLSEVFTARPEEEDPLVIYDFESPTLLPNAPKPSFVAGGFPRGITVNRKQGHLIRAYWAERWIREKVGSGWADPRANGGGSGGPSQRVLDRFGDILIVQNNRRAHRKVKELIDGFAEAMVPVVVDVAVLGATTPGGTNLLTARLRARATPRESGRDLVISNRIIEEVLDAAKPIGGLKLLGTGRVTLTEGPSATLEITQRSEDHPIYDGVPAPPLTLTMQESRYGLSLELYAEDLERAPGARRAALGIRAITREPTGSVVAPKAHAGGDLIRLARPMKEQLSEAYRVVPHAGTVVMHGLTNPFPESRGEFPGLIVLVGVRPAGDSPASPPTPDPSRRTPEPAPTTLGPQEREYDLGPLGSEVADEVLDASWPRRPASIPVPSATARRVRERYLADALGASWSGLARPGEASPVTVDGHTARASLPSELHARLEQAVQRVRANAEALYEVDVVTAEMKEETLAEWLRAGAVESFTPGTYLVTNPEAHRELDQRMRSLSTSGGLYTLQSRLLARSTQRVAARNVRTLRIVEDIRIWRGRGGMRYTPVPGTAEEGIVILVRPELEDDGKRLVTVDARAARLRSLESIALPGIELEGARVTVPRHFPVQGRQAGAPLSDDEAVLLTLPAPEGTGRVIAVKVRVRKVQ